MNKETKLNFSQPFAKLWLLIFASKELYHLRSTPMDVSYLIWDVFGSGIILIGSAVQKLRLNIHQKVLVLSRQQTRPEHTAVLCLRCQLMIAEMAGMPPLKSGIQGELSGHIFLLSSVAQMFLREGGHLHWGNQQLAPLLTM